MHQKKHVIAAKNEGLRVAVWTVNRAEDMQRMIDWGVDTIITDHPVLLGQILDK